MTVQTTSAATLSDSEIKQINDLTDATWPSTVPPNVGPEQRIFTYKNRNQGKLTHRIFEGDLLSGYAESFSRVILTEKGPIEVLGLAAVCVDMSCRGKGYGAELVLETFKRVESGEFEASLFQTGVPQFYEKLGAKEVHNRFINSKSDLKPNENPWWDEHIIVFPKSFNWPDGIIDMNGPGY